MIRYEDIKRITAEKAENAVTLAKQIWDFAELSYKETRSSQAIISALRKEGFSVEPAIADIPTAFRAAYKCGTGKPVMGFLAEFDALDGLSQKAGSAEYCPLTPGAPGHGCGHNLLGAGAWLAAVAAKDWLVQNNGNGTVVLFGCPAEEGAGSKQFIARAGYFDAIDFVYTWHPAFLNRVPSRGSVAIMGANFIFDGVASHAGGAPHLGRSVLDACELMNVGVNYLREHMIDAARIHYAYSDAGGTAPNVVQSHAVIKYEVRAPKVKQVKELFTRVTDIAKGAALMTGTTMKYEIAMAFSDYTPNRTLGILMDECLRECGAPEWTEDNMWLASAMLRSYPKATQLTIYEDVAEVFGEEAVEKVMLRPLDTVVHPFDPKEDRYESGSTDVGDVGYAVPTVELNIATACLGNVGHTWQNTAFSCSDIGFKGMIKAADVMALSALRTMEQPELIAKAKEELLKKNGGAYRCPLPDYIQPPIDSY